MDRAAEISLRDRSPFRSRANSRAHRSRTRSASHGYFACYNPSSGILARHFLGGRKQTPSSCVSTVLCSAPLPTPPATCAASPSVPRRKATGSGGNNIPVFHPLTMIPDRCNAAKPDRTFMAQRVGARHFLGFRVVMAQTHTGSVVNSDRPSLAATGEAWLASTVPAGQRAGESVFASSRTPLAGRPPGL